MRCVEVWTHPIRRKKVASICSYPRRYDVRQIEITGTCWNCPGMNPIILKDTQRFSHRFRCRESVALLNAGALQKVTAVEDDKGVDGPRNRPYFSAAFDSDGLPGSRYEDKRSPHGAHLKVTKRSQAI